MHTPLSPGAKINNYDMEFTKFGATQKIINNFKLSRWFALCTLQLAFQKCFGTCIAKV
jgi:hypothetical protein